MTAPSISIVLPFRNAGDTFAETLRSIQQQTLTEFECLAIDDHSTDHSSDIVTRLADSRFKVLSNPGHGLVNALNYGLQQARAALVARMDADDIMYPARLAKQFEFLNENTGTTLLATQVRKFPESLVKEGYREYLRWQNQCITLDDVCAQIYIESPFAHPSVMFRKQDVAAIGNYRDGAFPEDYDLWLRLFHAGYHMQKLPEILLDWRESESRLSRTSPRYSRAAFDSLRAEYMAIDPRLNTGRPLAIWGAGRRTRRRADCFLAKGFEPIAWIDIDPKKIGNIIDGVPVVASHWLAQPLKPFVLVYVSNHGAKDSVDTEMAQLGYRLQTDYLHVG